MIILPSSLNSVHLSTCSKSPLTIPLKVVIESIENTE